MTTKSRYARRLAVVLYVSALTVQKTSSHDYRHRIVLQRLQFSSPDHQTRGRSKQHKFYSLTSTDTSTIYNYDNLHLSELVHVSEHNNFKNFEQKLLFDLNSQTRLLSVQAAQSASQIITSYLSYVKSSVLQYDSDPVN